MSQERRERQKEKLGIKTSGRNWGRIAIYAVLIVAAFGLAYYLSNRSQHQARCFRALSERTGRKDVWGVVVSALRQEQKEKFGASFEYAPYVECGIKGDLHGQIAGLQR